jgi:CheY-like chemotaxis protein
MKPNYTFLLIEDNAIDQIITSKLLKSIDGVTEVNIVNNGKEGIQWLDNYPRNANDFLIILTDIKMPEMDGFGFLAAFEKLDTDLQKQTQIFILSSTLNDDEIARGNNNRNVKKMLSKPLPFKEFSEMIHPHKC